MSEDPLEAAAETLNGIIRVAESLGIAHTNLGPNPLGAGFGVSYGDEDFCVVSVHAGRRYYVRITSAVLRGVQSDERPAIVDAMNAKNVSTRALTHILHLSEESADILLGLEILDEAFLQVPQLFKLYIEGVIQVAQDSRSEFRPIFGGSTYHWTSEDVNSLLWRSLA